jgi:uncharacterized protein (UPF0335 family)
LSDIFNDTLQAIAANLQQLMLSVEQLQEGVDAVLREGGKKRTDRLRRIDRLEDAIIDIQEDINRKYGVNETHPQGDKITHYETRSAQQRLSSMHEQVTAMIQQIERLQVDPSV